MKTGRLLVPALSASLLVACAPHPSAGQWEATSDNELGIRDLSIQFEGRAEFVTAKKDIAVWHCFWGGKSQTVATMNCVPSTDTERQETYVFAVGDSGEGQLSHRGKVVAIFERKPAE